MSISAELEARILRYYHVEKWRVGTIARQLQVHHGTVQRVLRRAGAPSAQHTPRPSKADLYYPGYSNPNLQPEKSLDNDATIVLDSARGSLSLGWFSRSGSNFIVLNPATYIPFDAQRAQTAGIAVTARSKPIHGLIADLSFTNLYRALDLTTDARLPRSPVGQASAGITRPFGPTRTAFGVRFGVIGSDGDDTANVPPPLIGRYDSYTSVDAYVRCKLSKDGIVTVRGFNLGNDREAGLYRRTVVRVCAGCSGTNLDLWLDGEEGVRRHVSATAGEADILVIEGMMGL